MSEQQRDRAYPFGRFEAPWSIAWVALLAFYLFPYSAELNNPNERTRVLQARALVERRQLHIGETFMRHGRLVVEDLYGRRSSAAFVNDVALVCTEAALHPPDCEGKIYPAKAPGTALLGVPALALARALGFVPDGAAGETRATWVLRYGGVTLFLLVSLWALRRELLLAGVGRPLVERLVLATGLGSAVFPYAISFVGHVLSGAALLAGLFLMRAALLRRGLAAQVWAAAAGLATGSSVLLEYHAAVAVAVVCVWMLLARWRRLLLPGFAAGGLAMVSVHAALHQRMFGSPLRTGHFFLMTEHNRAGQGSGFLGIDGFHLAALRDYLFDPYLGLTLLMPWVFVGVLLGTFWLLSPTPPRVSRELARAALSMVLVYLLFVATMGQWRVMNGWSVGPRYLAPMMLPMALVAGHGWWHTAQVTPVLGRVCAGLAAASVVVIVAITASYPSPPPSVHNSFGELVPELLPKGYGVRNVLMAWGRPSLIVLAALTVLAAGWVALGRDHARQRRSLSFGLSLAVALAWTGALLAYRPTPRDVVDGAVDFCRGTLEGVAPDQKRGFFE